jgi:hypothetical protein
MSSVYCGIGDVPKGYKRGNMTECVEKGQIRYYGIKKIDTRTLETAKNKELVPETRDKLIKRMTGLRGLIRRNKGRYETTKDSEKAKKEEYYKLWQSAEKELKEVLAKLQKIEKVRENEKEKQRTASAEKEKNKNAKKTEKKSPTGSANKTIKKVTGTKPMKKVTGTKTAEKVVKKVVKKVMKKVTGTKSAEKVVKKATGTKSAQKKISRPLIKNTVNNATGSNSGKKKVTTRASVKKIGITSAEKCTTKCVVECDELKRLLNNAIKIAEKKAGKK